MKALSILKLGIFAAIVLASTSSCGGGDDPINDVVPNPSPAKIVKVESVSLDVSTLNLEEGNEKTITVTISPSNAANKKYTLTSSDSNVVTVDENGKVKALKSGEATIMVTTSDGNKTATCKVIVSSRAIHVESIKLDNTELALEEGCELTISCILTPDDATDKSIIWSSSDSTVVAVDENGKLMAVKAGEATITATSTDGNKTATCKVTVMPKVIQIELQTELTILEGRERYIGYSTIPEDAFKIIIWSSSDPTIVVVDEHGYLTALKAGEAIITATTPAGNITATCKVIVDKIIEFADGNAKEMCVRFWDKNNDGELGMSEAASVLNIDKQFFAYCPSWGKYKKISHFNEFQCFTSLDGISEQLFLDQDFEEIALPPNITYIGASAFDDCSILTSINVPEGVTSIGNNAFDGCHSLTNITLPSTLSSIGSGVFYECWSLESINIPEGVTSIGSYAFKNCRSLTNINIPEGVTSIGSYAFYNCRSLTNITLPSTLTSIGDAFGIEWNMFLGTPDKYLTLLSEYPPKLESSYGLGGDQHINLTIFVPSQAVDRYKENEDWKRYASRIKPIP